MHYRGLTWDHPRGHVALREAAKRFTAESHGDTLSWSVHSLEDFESAPIEAICNEYDLIVLDHPHLGDALKGDCLQPIADALGENRIEVAPEQYVGPSIASYSWEGQLWAVPLDAAAQVAAFDPTRIDEAPRTWDDVELLSRDLPVSLSLSGPHALLSLFSICATLGTPADDLGRIDRATALDALNRMRSIARRMKPDWISRNPIDLLESISSRTDVAYCPLVFGYVNYARRPSSVPDAAAGGARVEFADVPSISGMRGSVIGGTGLAISRSAVISPAMAAHIAELVGTPAQCGLIVDHDGQPSRAEAWTSASVDARSGHFYSATHETISQSWVRPRFAGFTKFQSAASSIIRDAVLENNTTIEALDAYEGLRARTVSSLPKTGVIR